MRLLLRQQRGVRAALPARRHLEDRMRLGSNEEVDVKTSAAVEFTTYIMHRNQLRGKRSQAAVFLLPGGVSEQYWPLAPYPCKRSGTLQGHQSSANHFLLPLW